VLPKHVRYQATLLPGRANHTQRPPIPLNLG
jgi:hypothetical protein